MKKILIFIVCFLMMGMQQAEAHIYIAALHHEGQVTFYSVIQTAIDNAVPGDSIYLSEGTFAGFTVAKPIAIIGAGQTTKISGDVTLGKTDSTVIEGLSLSGLTMIQDVDWRGVVTGARIMQCTINGTCRFYSNSGYSFDDIEISMSKLKTLDLSNKVELLSVIASKINTVTNHGSGQGAVTLLNCNVTNIPSYSDNLKTFINCIIDVLGYGVYINCLYRQGSSSTYTVIDNCYENANFTLDEDLNCSLTDEELKQAGYLGTDNTWVGINGGKVKYSLVMPQMQITEHNIEVNQADRKLQVTLKLGNK